MSALALLFTMSAPTAMAAKKAKPPVDIQILGLNDFHGQLEVVGATASSGGRIGATLGRSPDPVTCPLPGCIPAGGVEYLATHVRNLRAENPNTVFVSAGALIGATPL